MIQIEDLKTLGRMDDDIPFYPASAVQRLIAERDQRVAELEAEIAKANLIAAGMVKQCEVAEAELERERMRLAACGTAALGYFDGCNDEYKSASLDDVLCLRAERDAALKDADRWKTLENLLFLGDVEFIPLEDGGYRISVDPYENYHAKEWYGNTPAEAIDAAMAKGEDALYSTRHGDFVKHAAHARAKMHNPHWLSGALYAFAQTHTDQIANAGKAEQIGELIAWVADLEK